jgi:hypothetical protein
MSLRAGMLLVQRVKSKSNPCDDLGNLDFETASDYCVLIGSNSRAWYAACSITYPKPKAGRSRGYSTPPSSQRHAHLVEFPKEHGEEGK